MPQEWLIALDRQATLHWVVEAADQVIAFLMAFREGTAYDSPSYRWFAARYPQFLYLDRIVVDSNYQSQGIGSFLYQQAFEFAIQTNVDVMTYEYDVVPPNERSARLHAKFGFTEVGQQTVANGKKVVSLQAVCLSSANPKDSKPQVLEVGK
jgi:predicted GNAT superfamily acetyltransferase